MNEHSGELGAIAHQWFEVMRKCADEVRELLHDGCPVACLGDAPFGFEVLLAEDGTKAQSILTESRPDLALLDIRMPGRDGLTSTGGTRQWNGYRTDHAARSLWTIHRWRACRPALRSVSRSNMTAFCHRTEAHYLRSTRPLWPTMATVVLDSSFQNKSSVFSVAAEKQQLSRDRRMWLAVYNCASVSVGWAQNWVHFLR